MSLSRLPGRILRADREVLAAALRREAGILTRRGRTAVVSAMSGLVDLGDAADARYAHVLGGHTLNLVVTLPAGAEPSAVVLARRGVHERLIAVPCDGGAAAETVVPLGHRRGGLALEPGRWRILLELTRADGRTETRPVRLAVARPDDGGPTLATSPCPDTGYRYAIEGSPSGALLLTVAAPAPAAELTALRTLATGLELTGRFVGVGGPAEASIVFTGPDRREHRVAALVRDGVFTAAVPAASVASLADGPGERTWKVWADVPGAGRLRVGRFLTDLRSPHTVHRRPNRMVRVGEGEYAMVRTAYATGGGLRLVCAAGRTEP